MPKRLNITATVSPEELEIIDAKARESVLSRSEYLRRTALKQQVRTRSEEELYRELIRLGLRLQTIQGQSEHGDLNGVLADIRQAIKQVTEQ